MPRQTVSSNFEIMIGPIEIDLWPLTILFIDDFGTKLQLAYLCSLPTADASLRSYRPHLLRSASRRKLNLPRFHRSTFGTRAFSVAGRRFGTHCLIRCVMQLSSMNVLGGTWKRISLPSDMSGIALYTSTFTYLLTYLWNFNVHLRHLIISVFTVYRPRQFKLQHHRRQMKNIDRLLCVMYVASNKSNELRSTVVYRYKMYG